MKRLQRHIDKVDDFQQKHHFFGFSYAVIKKYGDDRAGYWAALLTYYGFLALFPLLMILTTIAENTLNNYPELRQTITDGVTDYFPVMGEQLSGHINALQSNGFALIAGILFTLYGVRGVAEVFQYGIRKVWGQETKNKDGFPAGIIKSLSIIIVGGLGFISAAVIASLAAAVGQGWAFRGVSIGLNLIILFCLFNFLIKVSLPKHITLKDTWLGAACAAVGLVILQMLGGYILTRELRNLDALYSYYALTLGLLFWIYLQAQTIYYANEIAVVRSKKLWPRSFTSGKNKN